MILNIFSFLFFLSASVFAENSSVSQVPNTKLAAKIPSSLVELLATDSWKDDVFDNNVSPYFRYQVLRFKPIQDEYGEKLYISKFQQMGETSPIKHHYTKKVIIMNAQMKKELKSLSWESGLGCYKIKNLKWTKFNLSFEIVVKNNYRCYIKNVNKQQHFKSTCKKSKQ